jgi:hypothetical protein
MSGGIAVNHIDDEPLFTGTHSGGDGSNALLDHGAMFRSLGVMSGLLIENETQGTTGTVSTCTDDRVYTGEANSGEGVLGGKLPLVLAGEEDLTWNNGDTYNIYKTTVKNSPISYSWVDVSRGWQAYPEDLVKGWRSEDADLDDHGQHEVFGPGQPE